MKEIEGNVTDQFLNDIALAKTSKATAQVFKEYEPLLITLGLPAFNEEFYKQIEVAQLKFKKFDYKKIEVKPKKPVTKQVETRIKQIETFKEMKLSDEETKQYFSDGLFFFCSENHIPLSIHLLEMIHLSCYNNEIQDKEKFCIALFKATNNFKSKPKSIDLPITEMGAIISAYSTFFKKHEEEIEINGEDYASLKDHIKKQYLKGRKTDAL